MSASVIYPHTSERDRLFWDVPCIARKITVWCGRRTRSKCLRLSYIHTPHSAEHKRSTFSCGCQTRSKCPHLSCIHTPQRAEHKRSYEVLGNWNVLCKANKTNGPGSYLISQDRTFLRRSLDKILHHLRRCRRVAPTPAEPLVTPESMLMKITWCRILSTKTLPELSANAKLQY